MNNSEKDKITNIITKPTFGIPIAVLITYIIHCIIGEMDPLRGLFIVLLFILVGTFLGWFAMIVFRKLNEPDLQVKQDLESLTKKLSLQIGIIDFKEFKDKILFEEDLKKIETEARTVWVISKNLKVDTQEPLMKWVSDNLGKDVKYIWLVPDTIDIKPPIRLLIKSWENKNLLIKKWKFILVPSMYFVNPHDLTIYDVEHEVATRIVEFILGRDRLMGYKLPEELHQDISGITLKWINMSENNKLPYIDCRNYKTELTR